MTDETSVPEDAAAESAEGQCPCGRNHKTPPEIVRMIHAQGPTAVMRGPEGAWHVPRVFAAAHNPTAATLQHAAEQYGFESA